ncbi:MAG: signal recognition particle-docking protein FtsY [Oscillospiraceae bacterium]|nr:signal recognition particle-docking protein FtsY [Oscillospiraceae bacterium]
MGFFDKIRLGLAKTRGEMTEQLDQAFRLTEKISDDLYEELEEILIMSDIGMDTSIEIIDMLKEKVKKDKLKLSGQARNALIEIIAEVISGDEELNVNTKLSIMLVLGVNGVGKTTTIGKLASYFKNQGKSVILGAADTFRAAATEQLEIWANRTDCQVVKHREGADPAAVVFDTISAAKKRSIDIAICDTAGRLHNKKNLMSELLKISNVVKREGEGCDVEILLVVDATTGQNGVVQAREFKKAAGLTGIILTKLDGTAKGGIVIPIKQQLELPIKFVGVGEGIDDLQPFDAKLFTKALFDTNDAEDIS